MVNFELIRSNYAVTQVSVPVGMPESMSATLVIKRGCAIVGQVSNQQGKVISGATVRAYHNYRYRKLSTKTDTNGHFELFGLSNQLESKVDIVIQSTGMAPQLHTVQLSELTNTLNLILTKGNLFRGRISDEAGNPISKVVVQTDFDFNNQIDKNFEWRTETDADGRFEWDSAPAEAICYWFEANGYNILRGHPLLADGSEHKIILKQKPE